MKIQTNVFFNLMVCLLFFAIILIISKFLSLSASAFFPFKAFTGSTSLVIIVFVIILLLLFFLLDRIVIRRLQKTNRFLQEVIQTKDASLRINPIGQDEITELSLNLNALLDVFNNSLTDLREGEERLHLLMDATNDGYLDYNVSTNKVTISYSFLSYLGYLNQENTMRYSDILHYLHPQDIGKFEASFKEYLDQSSKGFRLELRISKSDGSYIYALIRGKAFDYDSQNNPTRWIASLLDITEEKRIIQENIYLLQTDPVTQLKNRAYLENIFNELDDQQNFCILMADVNELKLTNDVFGHKDGDRLLSIVSTILRDACSESDLPVRWGGDEFLILIRNSFAYAHRLEEKIKKAFDAYEDFPIKISAAIGCAEYRSDDSIDKVIKRAEDRMYHHKLQESGEIKKELLSIFRKRSITKLIINTEKIEVLKELSGDYGKWLHLSADQLKSLCLLCEFYNIGKITLADSILQKNREDLSDDEWRQYRNHPESGYRIAKTIPDIDHISSYILAQFENVDGSGYPNGLIGNEIPYLSRILSIILYYYPLKNNADRLQSLKKAAGSQLDPLLTDQFLSFLISRDRQTRDD